MSTTFKPTFRRTEGGDFPKLPDGTYPGVVVLIEPTMIDDYNDPSIQKPGYKFIFAATDGDTSVIAYKSVSNAIGPKSNLSKYLTAIAGKTAYEEVCDDDEHLWDLMCNCVGKGALLSLELATAKKSGNEYNKLTGVLTLPKGMESSLHPARETAQRFREAMQKKAEAEGKEAARFVDDDGVEDDIPF